MRRGAERLIDRDGQLLVLPGRGRDGVRRRGVDREVPTETTEEGADRGAGEPTGSDQAGIAIAREPARPHTFGRYLLSDVLPLARNARWIGAGASDASAGAANAANAASALSASAADGTPANPTEIGSGAESGDVGTVGFSLTACTSLAPEPNSFWSIWSYISSKPMEPSSSVSTDRWPGFAL